MNLLDASLRMTRLFLLTTLCSNLMMTAAAASTTQVIEYKPTTPSGKVLSGYCWTNSIAANRADAWRCMIGNAIHDPCFTTSEPNKLICNFNPIRHTTAFTLKLTKPLPKPEVYHNTTPAPWLLQLSDDSVCQPFTGTMPFTGQYAISYYCTGPAQSKPCEMGLMQDSIKSGKTWMAKKVIYCPSTKSKFGIEVKKIETVSLAKVWQ